MHTPKLERPKNGGVQKIYAFDNGYGASVVKHAFSYGGDQGLWELAVLIIGDGDPLRYYLTYDTPVTDDVIGRLCDNAVEKILDQISQLDQLKGEM